jgi:hypothetical protein
MDGDWILDCNDAFPYDRAESVDTDGDGTGDNADADDDNDGIADAEEDARSGGDGNSDGVPDRLQTHVVSLPTPNGAYITLVAPEGARLTEYGVMAASGLDAPPGDVDFEFGILSFTINGITLGSAATLAIHYPADAVLETYYKYGPTPDDPDDHWYEFLYDGETGAEIDGINKVITLRFVDAARGDDLLQTDGRIIDLGGSGIVSPTDSSGSSGSSGCFIGSVFK